LLPGRASAPPAAAPTAPKAARSDAPSLGEKGATTRFPPASIGLEAVKVACAPLESLSGPSLLASG
jgi:hypothetical protein